MSRSPKQKKNKVPKITEEEYVAYLSVLKGEQIKTPCAEQQSVSQNTDNK